MAKRRGRLTSMAQDFLFKMHRARVLFGDGMLERLTAEKDAFGASRVVILSTPQQTDLAGRMTDILGQVAVGTYANAQMHTPVEITDEALDFVRGLGADLIVAGGGGSTIGLGKALALRTGLPVIAVPTTYAGSEMTPILGETKEGLKTTISDERVLPRTVIYDVSLTESLPVAMSVASGLNAMAHSAEALYAREGNPIVTLMAEQSITALSAGLRKIMAGDRDGRHQALYGAWLAGTCLGLVGMALHHKLCHVLGGTFDLPHAETHAIMLPHAMAYNAEAAPDAMRRLAGALGVTDPIEGLWALVADLKAPTTLAGIGMPETGIDRAADLALKNAYWNPRPLERDAIHGLLSRAYAGKPPSIGQ